MILLDAYALVAIAGDEPAAVDVERLLREAPSAITAINLAEAIDVLHRVHGIEESGIRAAVEPVIGTPLAVVPVSEEHAWRAAALRHRHYHRRFRPLSLGDCFLLAGAAAGGAIATADPVVAEVAVAEKIDLVPLPDSAGRLPDQRSG